VARRRLIFVGLDGVGLDLARHLALGGVMPNLGRIMAEGAAWATDSPLPDVSPVCWTSLFCGEEPGVHGVYGFAHPRPGAHGVACADSRDVLAPRLWELADRQGLRAAVLGVPLTYPAQALDGVMISGFVCPELAGGVHPPALLARLDAAGYRPEADLEQGRHDVAALLADIDQALTTRLAVFEDIWAQERWPLFIAVITDTDRVNHFAWPALWQDEHPLAPAATAIYRRIDDYLGRLRRELSAELADGRARLVLAADHAFGPIRSEVYLNPWLREQGLLAVEGQPPNERILPETLALALDPGRIHLHWAGRFAGGRLRPGRQAQELLERIATGLLELRFNRLEDGPSGPTLRRERPIAQVHLGQRLYHGPNLQNAPDLVAVAAPGYSLRAGLDRPGVFGLSHLCGTHRPHGALACCLPASQQAPPTTVAGLGRWLAQGLALREPFAIGGQIALN